MSTSQMLSFPTHGRIVTSQAELGQGIVSSAPAANRVGEVMRLLPMVLRRDVSKVRVAAATTSSSHSSLRLVAPTCWVRAHLFAEIGQIVHGFFDEHPGHRRRPVGRD